MLLGMDMEIVLFDGFDELDALGAWEVLSGAASLIEDLTVRLVTLDGAREVRADHGAVIRSQAALSPRPDVLIVPGGGWLDRSTEGAWGQAVRGELPQALAERHARGTVIASVCTGALLLAASGILAGRRATTNPRAVEELSAAGAQVVRARVVDDGDIVTGGAPACSLDVAIHLLGRYYGPQATAAATRALQYELPPPEHYLP